MDTLRKIWAVWKRVGQAIGDFMARVVLSIFYFTIFAPFGLGVRLTSDPLQLKRRGAQWDQREVVADSMEQARRLH